MVCPKCGSDNVNAQMVSESQIVPRRRARYGGFLLVGGGCRVNGFY